MADDATLISLNESIARKDLALRKFAQDTNNYYGVIQGYVSLLEMQMEGDERVAKCLEPINSALDLGIKLNKQISALYRSVDMMVVRKNLAELVQSTAADYAAANNYSVDVMGHTEEILLELSVVTQLIKDLCTLAKKAANPKATFELASVTLSQDEAARMVLDAPAGKYAQITIEIDTTAIEEDDETLFFNPFVISAEDSKDIGVGGIFGILRNHGGNIDVASNDQTMIINIYFPV